MIVKLMTDSRIVHVVIPAFLCLECREMVFELCFRQALPLRFKFRLASLLFSFWGQHDTSRSSSSQ